MTIQTHLLIVDDETELLNALKTFFVLRNIHVDTVSNPADVMSLLSHKTYSLILLDIVMPKLTGIELLKMIKQANPNQEVVMMTANSTLDKVMECRSLGASDYILKPFSDLEQIGSICLSAMERSRRWEQVYDNH